MTPLHPAPAPTTSRSPLRLEPHRPHRPVLGAELPPVPMGGGSRLVKAVLGGAPRLVLTDDGVLPARPTGVLPLRHGVTRTGAPATCLLRTPGLARLRAAADEAGAAEVDCAACRAWQATHGTSPRHGSRDVLGRLWAAIDDVFSRAA